jgi:hypothetical protein
MKKQLLLLLFITMGFSKLNLVAQNLPVQVIYPFSDSVPAPLDKAIIGIHWTGSQFWLMAASSSRRTISRYSPTLRYIDSIQVTGDLGTGTPVYDIETINGDMWIAFNKDSIAKISPTGLIIKKVKVKNDGYGVNTAIRTLAVIGNTGQLYVGGVGTGSTGNYIWKIDTLGNILQAMPYIDHRAEAIYGMVYDDKTTGGPYLWVNCQFNATNVSGGINGTYVRQLKLSNNTCYATCFEKNVFFDTPWAVGGTFFSAGGLTMGTLPGNTTPSLIALSQYSTFGGVQRGAVIAYNLNNFQPLTAPEIGLDSFALRSGLGGLTRFPAAVNSTVSYVAKLTNRSPTAASGNILTNVWRDSVLIASPSVPFSVNPFFSNNFSTPNVLGTQKGRYEIGVKMSAANDCNVTNDSISYRFTVTDSTYGRDVFDHPGVAFNPVSIGSTLAPRKIGMVYTFPHDVNITSLSILHRVLALNDSMYATVWRFKNGYPTDSLAASKLYNPTTAADTAGQGNSIGLLRTFPLISPLLVKKGDTIVVGMTELKTAGFYPWTVIADKTQSNYLFFYRSSVLNSRNPGWFSDTVPGMAISSERRTFVFRVNATVRTGTKDALGAIENVTISPNPTTGDFSLYLNLTKSEKGRIDIRDLSGRTVQTQTFEAQTLNQPLSLGHLPSGLYLVHVRTESGGQVVQKVVKQ